MRTNTSVPVGFFNLNGGRPSLPTSSWSGRTTFPSIRASRLLSRALSGGRTWCTWAGRHLRACDLGPRSCGLFPARHHAARRSMAVTRGGGARAWWLITQRGQRLITSRKGLDVTPESGSSTRSR